MGSRQLTAGERARLPALSRRAVLAGTSAAAAVVPVRSLGTPALPALPAPPGLAREVKPYERWLYLDSKIERLQRRWGQLESYLAREHGWFRLSDAEQRVFAPAQELRDIDGMLELLFEQREALLSVLPECGAASLEVVIARLAVVERLIYRDDHPEAHAMIAGAREDLVAWLHTRRQPTA